MEKNVRSFILFVLMMITQLPEILPSWLYTSVLQPYLEGAERINRFVQGVDLHQIDYPQLDWCDRTIHLITGIALMLPFVNSIVWIALQTFGSPEQLSDPYYTRQEPSLFKEISDSDSEVEAVSEASQRPIETEQLNYKDVKGDQIIPSTWTIETYPNRIVVKKVDAVDTAEAIYQGDWKLKRFHGKRGEEDLLIERHHNRLVLKGRNGTEEKQYSLRHGVPWIQQPTLGFKPFALSDKQQLAYYAIHPKDFSLCELIATKQGLENLPIHGQVLKIQTTFNDYRRLFWDAKMWFDPISGKLLRLESTEQAKDAYIPRVPIVSEFTMPVHPSLE